MNNKLHYRFEWLLAGWAMVAVIIYFSLTSSPPLPGFRFSDKVFHVAGYAGIMFWFAQLYSKAMTRSFYALGFMLMGAGLEVIQGLGGIRAFELADMLANITGVLVVWLLWRYRPINFLSWLEGVIRGKS